MFQKFNLVAGVLALLLFAYAQQQGWSAFDHVAQAGSGGSGSSRSYHK